MGVSFRRVPLVRGVGGMVDSPCGRFMVFRRAQPSADPHRRCWHVAGLTAAGHAWLEHHPDLPKTCFSTRRQALACLAALLAD